MTDSFIDVALFSTVSEETLENKLLGPNRTKRKTANATNKGPNVIHSFFFIILAPQVV
ncbi:hypothetical protein X847_1961 [Listeria monocytogenes Lm_1889]|uniref:Uncharacterized protein n=1 Tax=Listeria monocytogenes serovar 1/2a (strain ATCC BAA-679 / EGD-e) TaxID=169963 RepID=Q6IEG9_LISMO|nr:hypothetical protein LMOf6854_1019 [Listeria monocytogenes str. 1/2a F6854] [Listeria monocytogenes serotype 1/2a str. F6854]EXL13209.1 hypothetical protein X843_2306 [Listeria monocytogenes Lm_1840]EXL22423.1 hypothetical protein X847_1961 [Listeria monocytogenes Lm_1889]EXL24790.1 hypothetical protein X842_1086 [Listeria monocytogenes Lm_1880]QBZ18232.1 hypothetical protein FORC68_1004 [Listeria monocytogenes]DAA05315.1 TPA_exp: hypothetical protein NT01LM1053 [Listeria monocytogenes EGD-